jgi:hypothetical protein
MMAHSRRVPARPGLALRAACHARRLGLAAMVILGCARSGLHPGDFDATESFGGSIGVSESGGASSGGALTSGGTSSGGQLSSGGVGMGGRMILDCVPSSEVCNGKDDDCNGQIDELPGVTCPGGGFSYCVGGRMSACPMRCEVCVPGSERVCFTNFCTFWGTQTCTADGRSFGTCREHRPPPDCRGLASDPSGIDELEQCCIDRGDCCVDSEDLDHDGDRGEMLGDCEDVTCK